MSDQATTAEPKSKVLTVIDTELLNLEESIDTQILQFAEIIRTSFGGDYLPPTESDDDRPIVEGILERIKLKIIRIHEKSNKISILIDKLEEL